MKTINRPPRHAAVLAFRSLALAATAVALAGCTPVGALLYKLTPESEIPPQFTLKDVPTVVLVENYRNPDLAANDAELLARSLQSELDKYKVVATVIKTEKILDLRNNKPKEFATMTVPQIATAVGAKQVIYVDLSSGGISSMTGQSMFAGKAGASVKVVDADTGMTLFPPDSTDGTPVSFETDTLKGNAEGSYAAVRTELYDGMAKRIGRLFHKWKQSEDDADSSPPKASL